MTGTERLITNPRPSFDVDGAAVSRLGEDLIRLDVREDEHGLTRLEAVFINWGRKEQGAEPGFVYFDGETIALGQELLVRAGASDDEHVIFRGTVSALEGIFSDKRPPEICLRAEDASQWMRMRRRTRFFEAQSDGDLARTVADDHGLGADVAQNGSAHTELWQINQTDLDFLRDRARAADARIAVQDGSLVFRPRRDSSDEPQTLSREAELLHFHVSADLAHQRTEVRVHGYDVAQKAAIHEIAGPDAVATETEGAGRSGPALLGDIAPASAEDHHLEMPATSDEARTVAEALMRERARRFVRGHGITSGTPGLHVGSKVDLPDVGALFSGVYHLAQVRHTFDQTEGLRTHFTAERATLGGAS